MKRLWSFGLVVVFASGAAWAAALLPDPAVKPGETAAQPGDMPAPAGLTLDKESYPVTDGSTSAEPLGVWVAARLLGLECAWRSSMFEAQRRLLPMNPGHKEVAALYGARLRHHGTHGAYTRLINGAADLIYECRPPSPDEAKLMEERGVELEIVPIALDAFVFLRHRENPIAELTSEQVRDIYTRSEEGERGRIDNWNQVGGPDARINAYVRNPNSGSQETLKTLVMKDREIVQGRDMMGRTMMGPYNLMQKDKNGIGFTFFYYQRYMAPLSYGSHASAPKALAEVQDEKVEEQPVEMFAIDGVQPSRETIADGSYPWVTKVYAVPRKDLAPDHPAARLRAWLLTEEGRKIIAETGYVTPAETVPTLVPKLSRMDESEITAHGDEGVGPE